MSRIISTEVPGTMRNRLMKLTYLTSNELIKQNGICPKSKDMAAFIVLCFTKIIELVDQTAIAWEDRNYWSKSDAFQKEWDWVSIRKEELEQALEENNWPLVVEVATAVLSKSNLTLKSTRFTTIEPWKGAYLELQLRQHKNVHE